MPDEAIIGKALDSLIIGIICFVLMCILKLQYALLISIVVGITNMIPYFGPFIGAIPGLIILLIILPKTALIFLILILLLQQFDGTILGPKILGDSTGLSPIWIIFAITVGGATGGVIGMFLGVPITAVLVYLMNHIFDYMLYKKHLRSDLTNVEIPDINLRMSLFQRISQTGRIHLKISLQTVRRPAAALIETEHQRSSKDRGNHLNSLLLLYFYCL